MGVFLAIAITGCGSSGDPAEVTVQGTFTKAQYLKLARPICKQGVNEITDHYRQWEKADTGNRKRSSEHARDIALAEVAVEAHKKQLQRLREIGLPHEEEEFVSRLYEAWEEGVENGEDNPESMQESNERFAFHQAYAMSVDYGLGACWFD
ncbi:MAG: hypothetical protein ACJ76D_00785 [Solirubrobacterales bacterium]